MIAFPKPRGFWDYALFALAMTGLLVFLFWLEATDGIGLADAALALAVAALFVLGVIIARRGEKATWIARPTWPVYLLVALGAFLLIFGAIYADSYLLHRTDITFKRLRRDTIVAITVIGAMLWSSLRRRSARRQLS
jgi:hypothetical protein